MRTRYSRWDDSQDPFGPEVDAAEVLEELSDDMLSGAGIQGALSRLLRRGMQGRFGGLDALRARLREQRAREQDALNLQGPLEDLRERLEQIVERERTTLSFEAGDDARMREAFLDRLPPDVPGRIRELQDYRFVDPQAARDFEELMEHLREEVMGAYFRSMAQGMRSMSAEEIARFRDMRDELRALAAQVLQDMDLAFEVDRLGANLSQLFPEMPWGEPTLAAGEDAMPFSAAVDAIEPRHDYADLGLAMRGDYPGA